MKIFRNLFDNPDPDSPGRLLGGKDFLLYIFLIIVCLIISAVPAVRGGSGYGLLSRGDGDRTAAAGTLEIYVDGNLYGEYDTRTDRNIRVDAYNGTFNTVCIENGNVSMSSASCHNQLCVKHAPIRYGGEEIICLPDRVVLRLLVPDEEGYDALSR